MEDEVLKIAVPVDLLMDQRAAMNDMLKYFSEIAPAIVETLKSGGMPSTAFLVDGLNKAYLKRAEASIERMGQVIDPVKRFLNQSAAGQTMKWE